MLLGDLNSPVQIILAQSDGLSLTPEQRQNLEMVDLELRSDVLRLSGERQLLELAIIERAKADGHGLGLTSESLSQIDTVTAKLRQVWLRAYKKGRAVLSGDQLAKFSEVAIKVPGFDTGLTSEVGLDTRVAEAVATRIKDAKVVEVEVAEAIAQRLFGWAKIAAFLTAVPLGLLIAVLTVLGVSNWSDFNKSIADGKKEVQTRLDAAKNSAETFDTQAKQLQAQFADLKRQYGDVTSLATDVSTLSQQLQGLAEEVEKIRFEKSPELLPETQAAAEKQIRNFRSYLQSLGYHPPAAELKVVVDPNVTDNAYYDGQKMVIAPKLVAMPDVIYRDYSQRMLKETNPGSWTADGWKVRAIFSGLSDYFPCSYQGNPKFGVQYAKEFPATLTPEQRSRGLLRDLTNKRLFVKDSADVMEQEEHGAGEVWGGMFWNMRTILGCKLESAGCSTADTLLFQTWTSLDVNPVANIDVRFAQGVVQNIRQSLGQDKADKVRDAYEQRGLALPR
jgi:F0F1-type ATP synthase membrane subunit b/b'